MSQTEDIVAIVLGELDRHHVEVDTYHPRTSLYQLHKIHAEMVATLYEITAHSCKVGGGSQNWDRSDPMLHYLIHIVDGGNDNKYYGDDSIDDIVKHKIQPRGLVISWNKLRDVHIILTPNFHVSPKMTLYNLVKMCYCSFSKNIPPYRISKKFNVKFVKGGF